MHTNIVKQTAGQIFPTHALSHMHLGEECCKNCCYSTPFVTLGALVVTVVGLVGFTLSGLYGVAEQNDVEYLKNGYVQGFA